jgi:hypothetical protein
VNVTVRRALATAAATSVIFALAGCGGNDDDKAADTSPSTSSAADSSAPTTSPSTDAPTDATSDAADGSGKEISADEFTALLTAALDQATTAHVVLDLGATGKAEGDADYTKKPPALSMTMSVAQLGGDVEIRMVDGTIYIKSASFGDKWVSISADDSSSPLGGLGDELDVTKTLKNFADAVTSATDEGSEDVDGDTLEHYTATVDTDKLLQSMPDLGSGGASAPKTMTQDWWFDQDGMMRKFSSDIGGTATTVTLSDWGKDVSIEAPPADQVTTFPGTGGSGA